MLVILPYQKKKKTISIPDALQLREYIVNFKDNRGSLKCLKFQRDVFKRGEIAACLYADGHDRGKWRKRLGNWAFKLVRGRRRGKSGESGWN